MRISDWSSDVALPISLRGDRAARQRDREGDILAAAAEPRVREANAPRRDEAGQDFDRRLPIAGHFGDAVDDPRERGLERRRAIFALLARPVVDDAGADDTAKTVVDRKRKARLADQQDRKRTSLNFRH